MKAAAVICEYNPFHNGHKYQLDSARELTGCDAIVALMSGNFVQRGSFAVYPKQVRASAALACGADLILENPAPFTLRSAEGYAAAAIYTLSALNCVDSLVFGAESDDLHGLNEIAEFLAYEPTEFRARLTAEIASGLPFAAARARAVSVTLGSSAAELLNSPNNLLAVEYLKAIIRQGSALKPVLIQRAGAEHDSDAPKKHIASASFIRERLEAHDRSAFEYIPSDASKIYKESTPFESSAADKAIISALCLMPKERIAAAPDISEGLENKIKSEAMTRATLDELTMAVKSKRYAYSRIRRSLLCAYLGITAEDAAAMPKYIKILNFNSIGQAVLNTAKKSAALPLAKSAAPLIPLNEEMAMWKRCIEFDRVYELLHTPHLN